MKICLFYHSLLSDWNHGNAHFLRGVATELISRGHDVHVYEEENNWSLQNLRADHGEIPFWKMQAVYPDLVSRFYDPASIDLEHELRGADLVIVHEWNRHELVRRIGRIRAESDFILLFHDTHHRLVTDAGAMGAYDLSHYDGVLAYGEVLKRLYLAKGLARQAWTWHEAADTRVFYPRNTTEHEGDFVWIGNWGDDERTKELHEFLIEPVKKLGLKARVYGVRYPQAALDALARAGIEYGGWLPNFEVPDVFAKYRITMHVPRGPYVTALRGIPTIRPFEALACGIPLVSSPWDDCEGLFRAGRDFVFARNGREMEEVLKRSLADSELRQSQIASGLATIRARHTCAHRVDELMAICQRGGDRSDDAVPSGLVAPINNTTPVSSLP
ncbi:MAG: glycosyltransferase [Nibricoccus sp.]